jgi:hypothetical protein
MNGNKLHEIGYRFGGIRLVLEFSSSGNHLYARHKHDTDIDQQLDHGEALPGFKWFEFAWCFRGFST